MKQYPWKLIAFLSIALMVLGAVLPAILNRHVVGSTVDVLGTLWFHGWIAHCVETGTDPSFSDWMFYPWGKEIFAHTGNNFVDALVAQPFRWALGLRDYYPWFVLVILLGNAGSFAWMMRDLVKAPMARWAATALWTFNPFVIFELNNGRPTQAMLWFLPLAVRHFLRIQSGRKRDAIMAGVWTAFQGLTYWFLGFFMAIGFLFWAIVELIDKPELRRKHLAGWLLAGLVCLVLVSPFAVPMALGWSVDGVPGMWNDVGGLFDPPQVQANNVSSGLMGQIFIETTAQPMFMTFVWGGAFVASILAPLTRLRWGGLALLMIAFSLGPVVDVAPDNAIVLPHYMVLYRYLPFFSRLWFPYRWIVVAFFAISVSIGILLQGVTRDRSRVFSVVFSFLVVLAGLAEQAKNGALPLVHQSMHIPSVIGELGRRGGGVIDLPIGMAKRAMVWQTVHQQPTLGGMGENAPIFWPEEFHQRMASPMVRALSSATRRPDLEVLVHDRERWKLVDEGFRWVVLDGGTAVELMSGLVHPLKGDSVEHLGAIRRRLDLFLGAPVAVDGDVVVWDLTGGRAFEEYGAK